MCNTEKSTLKGPDCSEHISGEIYLRSSAHQTLNLHVQMLGGEENTIKDTSEYNNVGAFQLMEAT